MRDYRIADPRHPYAVYLLSLCLAAGIAQVGRGQASGSIAEAVPTTLALAWGVLLVLGASVSLTGIFWRSPLKGLLIEGVGQVMFAPAALTYAVVVMATAGELGVLAATPYIGFALAATVRLLQIHRAIRHVRERLLHWDSE